jgi:hypothetical protein
MNARTKNPRLVSIYRKRWAGSSWGADAWRKALGNPGKLPASNDVIRVRMISDDNDEAITIVLRPIGPKFVQQHRVHVLCDRCERELPAGRIHQHTC